MKGSAAWVALAVMAAFCLTSCVVYGEDPMPYATGSDAAGADTGALPGDNDSGPPVGESDPDSSVAEPDPGPAFRPDGSGVAPEDCGPCPLGFSRVSGSECSFDPNIISELLTTYTEGGFVRVNDPDFTQQFGPEVPRHVYVSETVVEISPGLTDTAAAIYAAIDPEDLEATIVAPLPMGTVIVHGVPHEHIGELTGEQIELGLDLRGVMAKREPGFHSEDNDWWFSRFTVEGDEVPQEEMPPPPPTDEEDPHEASMYGMSCMDCHGKDDRADRTDLLWGVPRAALFQ